MPETNSEPGIEPGRTAVVVCRLYPSQVAKLTRIARKLSPLVPLGNSAVLRWLVEHADEDVQMPTRRVKEEKA